MKSGPRHFASIGKRKSNRQYIREAQFAVKEGARVFAVLLAVLAQKGGDVTITQGTLDQVGQNLSTMGYAIVPGATKGEFIVRLTEGREVTPTPAPDASTATGTLPASAEPESAL